MDPEELCGVSSVHTKKSPSCSARGDPADGLEGRLQEKTPDGTSVLPPPPMVTTRLSWRHGTGRLSPARPGVQKPLPQICRPRLPWAREVSIPLCRATRLGEVTLDQVGGSS